MEKDIVPGGTDPHALSSAQLKSVLDKQNVEYPSDARKPKLIRLYKKHVAQADSERKTDGFGKSSDQLGNENAESGNETESGKNKDPLGNSIDQSGNSLEPANKSNTGGKVKKPEKKKNPKKKADPKLGNVSVGETSGVEASGLSTPSKDPNTRKETSLKNSAAKITAENTKPKGESPGLGPTAADSASKKRKSMLQDFDLKVSETPSKGNVFEVDSGSESDLLSPSVKRLKTAKAQASDSSTLHNSFSGASQEASTAGQEEKLKGEVSVSEKGKESEKEWSRSEESFEKSTEKSGSRLIDPETESEPGSGSGSESDSSEFDSALLKLKQTHAPVHQSPRPTNVELAKLFNIDPKAIKPKPRSTRNITPRRPIIISESLLDRTDELSGEDVPEKRVRPAPTEFYNNSDLSDVEDESVNLNLGKGSGDESESESGESESGESESESESENVEIGKKPSLRKVREETGRKASDRKVNGRKERTKQTSPSLSSKRFWPAVGRFLFYLSVWLSLVGVSLFAYWYREQSFYVGYCGAEINKKTIPQTPETPQLLVQFGEYLDANFKPQCMECPQHARCFPRLEMACYDDFYRYTPWYFRIYPSLNPQAQYCIPDTKKAEKIEIMIDVALDLLRARNANRECGKAHQDDVDAGIGISDLHDLLLSMKAPYITEEEFEELWQRSITELEKEPEIIVRFTGGHLGPRPHTNHSAPTQNLQDKVLRSTALSHLSLKCMMSNTLLEIVVRFKRSLAIFLAFLMFAVLANYKYSEFKLQQARVETLYDEVIRRLKKQAKAGMESSNVPAYIGSIHLRDLILSSENNLSKKMRLWQAVSRKVDRNTNVRHELIEVHGEVMKVWQWISVLDE